MNSDKTALWGNMASADLSAATRPFLAEAQKASSRLADAFAPLKDATLNLPAISFPKVAPPPPPCPVREEMPFSPTPQTVKYMLGQAGLDDIGLLESMLPKVVMATRLAPHRYEIPIAPILNRIKWRMRMASRFGMSMEVFRDERIDDGGKSDDLALLQSMLSLRAAPSAVSAATKEDMDDIRDRQSSLMAKMDEIGDDVAEGIKETRHVGAAVTALIPPRPADCQCSVRQLEKILGKLRIRRCERQIRRWEKYLVSGGRDGTKPPMGYTLQTRLTIASATAWAQSYAAHEKGKLSAKTFFDERVVRRRT